MEKLVAAQILLLEDWIACAERRLAEPSVVQAPEVPSDMTPERLEEMRDRLAKLKNGQQATIAKRDCEI